MGEACGPLLKLRRKDNFVNLLPLVEGERTHDIDGYYIIVLYNNSVSPGVVEIYELRVELSSHRKRLMVWVW